MKERRIREEEIIIDVITTFFPSQIQRQMGFGAKELLLLSKKVLEGEEK